MGTRKFVLLHACKHRDHPHAYGDKEKVKKAGFTNAGSSPRVWGQVADQGGELESRGIIPTRMGTSLCDSRDFKGTQDHPHAYGDKEKVKKAGFTNAGSSPRVWGQVADQGGELESRGIIPTRMGTSLCDSRDFKGTQDHPHAYGDKLEKIWIGLERRGSSPRVWGQG